MPRGVKLIDWSKVEAITIHRAACPHCGGPDYDKVRTDDNGDGSCTKRVRCKTCGENFKIIVEPFPVSGND